MQTPLLRNPRAKEESGKRDGKRHSAQEPAQPPSRAGEGVGTRHQSHAGVHCGDWQVPATGRRTCRGRAEER
eukprot:4371883-Alexandrium_andersonii.AAC.1